MKWKTTVFQILFLSLATAEQPSPIGVTDSRDRQWFLTSIPAHNSLQSTVTDTTPCLVRSRPVVKRDDYTYTPGIGGHKLHTRAVVFSEARRTCEDEGAHLAIINTIAEANVITELFKKSVPISGSGYGDFAYIGFHDLFQQGEYVTIHGETLAKAGYTNWTPGQPDNPLDGPERCGSVWKNGGLNDLVCNKKCGFICEMPLY